MEGEPIEQSQSEFETDFSSSPQDTGASSSGDDSDVDRRTLNTNNGSRFSTDYRHHLVTALKRRFKPGQDSQSQSNHNMQHMDDSMHSDIYDQQQQHQHGYEDTYQQDNMENHPDNLTRSHMTTRQPPTSYHHDVVHQPEQNSHSDDENHYPVDPFDGRVMTMDDSAVVNSRNTRVAQTETAIRQDMFKECTFKPVIRKLPRSYGTSATANDSFYDRVMKWQKERDALAKNRLKMHQESYKTDCTFNPQISRYSERAAAQSRAQSTKHSDSGGGGKISTNERLYKSTLLAREHKKFAEEEIKREQDEKLRQENEYRIHGAKNPKYKEIGPRVYNNLLDNNPNNSVLNQTPRGRSATPSKDPNCSFTPKVKGVSQQMTSAKLYLSANVVDRLTKPIAQQNKKSYDDNYIHNTNLRRTAMNDSEMDSRPDVMDVASFMSSLGGNLPYNTPGYKPNNNRARPQSAPRERYASDNMSIASQGSGINTVGTNASTQDKKARMEKFKQFLERQKQSQKKKTHNIQDVSSVNSVVIHSLSNCIFCVLCKFTLIGPSIIAQIGDKSNHSSIQT